MTAPTFTKSGTKATTAIKLDAKVFGVEVSNHQLLKDAYLARLAGMRANYAKAKLRGEVRGGGRKPWRQKGTGRARAGSTRSPIWRGGGITFGPTGEENYVKDLSARMRKTALAQALSLKAKSGHIFVIEAFEPSSNKTKAASQLIDKLGVSGNVLLALDADNQSSTLSTRNLKDVNTKKAAYIDAYDVLNADSVVLTKKSLENLSERLGE